MTGVELSWFVWADEGADVPQRDHNAPVTEADTVEALISAYRAAVDRAGAVHALDPGPHDRGDGQARGSRGHPARADRRGGGPLGPVRGALAGAAVSDSRKSE